MCVEASSFDENLLITGSVDFTSAIWDTRFMNKCVFNMRGHTDQVTQAKFSPLQPNLVATSSGDCRVMVWDLSRIGDPQTDEEMKDGPPELLFVHGGHIAKVSDISWNLNEELMLASVSEDNSLQVWQISNDVYYPEKDEV